MIRRIPAISRPYGERGIALNSRLPKSRLGIELIIYVVISLVLSTLFLYAFWKTSHNILESYLDKSTYVQQRTKSTLNSLQHFVDLHEVSVKDIRKVDEWIRQDDSVFLLIFNENRLIYDSQAINDEKRFKEHLGWPPPPWRNYYDITFSDATVQVDLTTFFEYQYKEYSIYISLALTFIFFVIVFLVLLRRKTSYIDKLEKEIKILEGGSLDYPITIKGKDELASLAESIDNMRRSFIERLECEDEARSSNLELVTAMSHDLRTPLTALIGYLDILEYNMYRGDDQLKQYIHNSRSKAYQLKDLSDKLFDYFLAFQDESHQPKLEVFQGNTLLAQIIGEYVFLLEDKGFQVEFLATEDTFDLRVEAASIQRTFDNLFSNIMKYSDPSGLIRIRYDIKQSFLQLVLTNQKSRGLREVESSGIGLKTCRRILRQHGGELRISETEENFIVEVSLPVVKGTDTV